MNLREYTIKYSQQLSLGGEIDDFDFSVLLRCNFTFSTNSTYVFFELKIKKNIKKFSFSYLFYKILNLDLKGTLEIVTDEETEVQGDE